MKIEAGYLKLKYLLDNSLTLKESFNFFGVAIPLYNNKNCGWIGQSIEKLIGLNNSNTNMDFEDGELKTIYSSSLYKKKIILTSKCNNLKNFSSIESSMSLEKISNILLVVIDINKEDIFNSTFKLVKLVNLSSKNYLFYNYIISDYYQILSQLKYWEDNSFIWKSINGNYKCLSLSRNRNKFFLCISKNLFDYLINDDINKFKICEKKGKYFFKDPFKYPTKVLNGTYVFDISTNLNNQIILDTKKYTKI